jgi:ABC-type multidrug transport system fused ATPase/permease subunit
LVKLLMGMYAPTAGEVLLDGVPLNDVDTEHWRRLTSGAFQDSVRLKTTVAEAVGAGDIDHMNDSARVRKAIETTGIDEFVDRLPDGEDTLLDRSMGGHELSGGQWQRLALARAHMRSNPNLQVLDEPTAALDPQARRNLWDLLRQINDAGRTVMLTTHYLDEAEALCDRVAIMDHGKILKLGPPAALVRGLEAPTRISVESGVLPVEEARAIQPDSTVEDDGVSLTIATTNPAPVLATLAERDAMRGLSVRAATLEDVFLNLTGREYRA